MTSIEYKNKCHKFWGQHFKKINWKGKKTKFYNVLSFIFPEVLILESWYFTGWQLGLHNGSSKALKKLFAQIFHIFECLLSQSPTNQGSKFFWFFQIIWKTIRKSKVRGLFRIIYGWKWFQIKFHCKFFQKTSRFWRPRKKPKTWSSD